MHVTTRLEKAITVAALAHRNQTRKAGNIPYIIHPFSVMCIASEVTDDEDTLIACLFHDIIEDVPDEYPTDRMREEFGHYVVTIVEGVTKDTTITDWQKQSEAYLTNLRAASDESVIVSAADKIHNLTATLEDHKHIGDKVWERFTTGKERQQWWYRSVLAVLNDRIPQNPLTTRLSELVTHLEKI